MTDRSVSSIGPRTPGTAGAGAPGQRRPGTAAAPATRARSSAQGSARSRSCHPPAGRAAAHPAQPVQKRVRGEKQQDKAAAQHQRDPPVAGKGPGPGHDAGAAPPASVARRRSAARSAPISRTPAGAGRDIGQPAFGRPDQGQKGKCPSPRPAGPVTTGWPLDHGQGRDKRERCRGQRLSRARPRDQSGHSTPAGPHRACDSPGQPTCQIIRSPKATSAAVPISAGHTARAGSVVLSVICLSHQSVALPAGLTCVTAGECGAIVQKACRAMSCPLRLSGALQAAARHRISGKT